MRRQELIPCIDSILKANNSDNRQEIEERTGSLWNDIVEPKDDGLRVTAQLIRESTDREIMTFINVNNHYKGSAPLTIQRLLELL